MKLATTISDLLPYAATPADAIRLFEGTGFRYLDYNFYNVVKIPHHPFMGENWKDQIYEAKETAEALGFRFVQAHAPDCGLRGPDMKAGLLGTIRSIEACGILGISHMVIHSGFFPEFHYPEDQLAYFKANEPFLRALIPAMEENNVHILLENTTKKHCPGGIYFPITGADLNDFVAFMDHPLFGAAWDIGHAHMDGLDHHDEIMTLGANLKAIHVHDNDGDVDRHSAPFTGNADFDSLMRGLIESGFSGYFTFEASSFLRYTRREESGPLTRPTVEIKRASVALMHMIGKTILETYDAYEA